MESLETILNELYLADPSLKENETAVRAIVSEMLAAKPDVQIDESFRQQLRSKLLAHTAPVAVQAPVRWYQKKFTLPLAFGTLAVGVVAVVVVSSMMPDPTSVAKFPFGGKPQFMAVAPQSFGALTMTRSMVNESALSSFSPLGSSPQTLSSVAPMVADSRQSIVTGNGTSAVEVSTPPSSGGVIEGKMIAPDMMPVQYTQYQLKYVGDPLVLTAKTGDVLKREKNVPITLESGVMKQLFMGLVDPNKLSGSWVRNMSLAQRDDAGYDWYIDPAEGMVSANYNAYRPWLSTPLAMPQYDKQLTEADLLADAELISIAEKFLDTYGIDRSAFGAPVVDNTWKVMYAGMPAAERSSFWFPQQQTVTFPIMINNQSLTEQWGGVTGVALTIDAQMKKVMSLYGLNTQQYTTSAYDLETDATKIVSFLDKGGLEYQPIYEGDVTTVDVTLGTPTSVYMRYWRYTETGGEELYVPALSFPVLEQPKDNPYYRTSVIVPLVKSIIDEFANQPQPVPMPLDVVPMIKDVPVTNTTEPAVVTPPKQ